MKRERERERGGGPRRFRRGKGAARGDDDDAPARKSLRSHNPPSILAPISINPGNITFAVATMLQTHRSAPLP